MKYFFFLHFSISSHIIYLYNFASCQIKMEGIFISVTTGHGVIFLKLFIKECNNERSNY